MDDPEDLERFFRIAQEREVGVIAMKVVARGALIDSTDARYPSVGGIGSCREVENFL